MNIIFILLWGITYFLCVSAVSQRQGVGEWANKKNEMIKNISKLNISPDQYLEQLKQLTISTLWHPRPAFSHLLHEASAAVPENAAQTQPVDRPLETDDQFHSSFTVLVCLQQSAKLRGEDSYDADELSFRHFVVHQDEYSSRGHVVGQRASCKVQYFAHLYSIRPKEWHQTDEMSHHWFLGQNWGRQFGLDYLWNAKEGQQFTIFACSESDQIDLLHLLIEGNLLHRHESDH